MTSVIENYVFDENKVKTNLMPSFSYYENPVQEFFYDLLLKILYDLPVQV